MAPTISANKSATAQARVRSGKVHIKDIFDGGIFTFLVGPEKARFDVHPQVIAGTSQPLAALMNNGLMQESLQRTATLPETDSDTFASLLGFAYFGEYTVRQSLGQPESTPTPGKPVTIPKLDEFCAYCGYLQEGAGRQACKKLSCVACRKHSIRTTYCVSCDEPAADCGCGAVRTSHAGDRSVAFLQRKNPLKDSTIEMRIETVQISQIIKLYLLADQYMVDGLKQLCLYKLHQALCLLDLDDSTIDGVCDMICLGCLQHGEGDLVRDDPLQGLILDYMVFEARKLVTFPSFQRKMLATGSPFIIEFTVKAISTLSK